MAKDPRYYRLLNTQEWRNLRRKQLAKEPRCQECMKRCRLTFATEVHHIIPIESAKDYEGMRLLAFDETNLMSLCSDCHHEIHTKMGSHANPRIAMKKIQQAKINAYMKEFFGKTDGED